MSLATRWNKWDPWVPWDPCMHGATWGSIGAPGSPIGAHGPRPGPLRWAAEQAAGGQAALMPVDLTGTALFQDPWHSGQDQN